MNTKLKRVQNWLELAKQANWTVSGLAKVCGVSVRALQRHFRQNLRESPRKWLREQRQKQAVEILRGDCSIKETAVHLGYTCPHHFSRDFKMYWGFPPSSTIPSKKSIKDRCRVLV